MEEVPATNAAVHGVMAPAPGGALPAPCMHHPSGLAQEDCAPLRQLQRVVRASDSAIFMIDAAGRVSYANAGTERMLGAPPGTLPGRRLLDLLAQPPSDERLQELLRGGGPPLQAGYRCDTLLQPRGRQPLWACAVLNSATDATLAAPSPPPGHLIGVLTDITATKVQEVLQRKVLDAMVHDVPLPGVAALLCREIERIAPDATAVVLEVDDRQRLSCLAAPGLDEITTRPDGQPAGPHAAGCGPAAWFSEAVACSDIATDPRWEGWREPLLARGLVACWSYPIRGRDGCVLGAFALYFREHRTPDDLHRHLVDVSLHLCSLLLERERAQRRIHQLAYHDAVTGLPNRACLLEHTERMIQEADRDGTPLAVAFIDLDRFKQVNDSLGHRAGDALLRELANRFRAASRTTDLVARIGGDEFAAVLPRSGHHEATATARRLLAAAERPMRLQGARWRTGASIGIALYPRDGRTAAALLHHADLAMYAAKQAGGQRLSVFHPSPGLPRDPPGAAPDVAEPRAR